MSLNIAKLAGLLIIAGMLLLPANAVAAPGAPSQPGGTVHVVQPGETLSLISSRYGVTVNAIMAANNLSNPNFIWVGQRLIIPSSSGHGSAGCANYYTVQWGDTLSGVAWYYGTSVSALMVANNLPSDMIYYGQELCVPSGSGPVAPSVPSQPVYSKPHCDYSSPIPPGSPCYDSVPAYYQPAYDPGYGYSQPAPAPAYQPSAVAAPTPAPSTGYPPATSSIPYPPPPPPPSPTEPVIISTETMWIGAQTADAEDPDGRTSLVVMPWNEEDEASGEGLDVIIRSPQSGFTTRGTTRVDFEFSWVPTFAFRDIPPGYYEVWIENAPSRVAYATVQGGHRPLVEFKPQEVTPELFSSAATGGWTVELLNTSCGSEIVGGFSILVVKTGANHQIVHVAAPGGYETTCRTGEKPEYGVGACNIGGLSGGTYQVTVDGIGVGLELFLDGICTADVEFRPGP